LAESNGMMLRDVDPRLKRRQESSFDRALAGLATLQNSHGAWEGEVVWCAMIAAQVAIARAIVGRLDDRAWSAGVRLYLSRQQRPDGGWGLHPLSQSTLFVTTLCYVALRLLGEATAGPVAAPALAWIRRHPEGVAAIPSWGKLWLAFLDLYPYDGITPIPPELFLAPRWSPVRPDQLYCHTRYIYLAIAALAGRRFAADLGSLRDQLRDELYGGRYATIDFARWRTRIAASDLYIPPGRLLRALYQAMAWTGGLRQRTGFGRGLRTRALAHCLRLIRGEVAATAGQCLSPVNGVLNLLALWAADPDDPAIDALLAGLEAWRWEDAGGIRYAGARSQGWDTAFALQALAAAPSLPPVLVESTQRGYRWLAGAQLSVGPAPLNPDRQALDGGWCFSDGAHRWPVSDCTAEAVTALLACHDIAGLIAPADRIPDGRIEAAIRFILARQNDDGGFGTYERRRGPRFLERLNPSEMFGNCMTELSYVECTASSLAALCHAARALPALARDATATEARRRAIAFLRRAQREDGAWPGFWGINFLYATCFAMRGLAAAGIGPDHAVLARAAAWVESVQRDDGGWGEHFSGCLTQRYVENDASLVSSTSWALLALRAAFPDDRPSLARGIAWLTAGQQADGGWQREAVNGVFFGSAMLEYPLYTTYFPALALAEPRHG
jgi:squalene/oxidosqualene cyclase-like protein